MGLRAQLTGRALSNLSLERTRCVHPRQSPPHFLARRPSHVVDGRFQTNGVIIRPTVLGGDGLGHTTQRVHVASPETTNSFSLLLQDPGASAVAAMAHRPWWQRVFDSLEPSPTPSPSPPPQLSRSAGIVLVSDEDSPVPLALRASDLPEWAPSPGDARWVDEFTRGGLGSLPRRQVSKMAGQDSRSGRRHAPRPRDHRGSQPRGAAPAVRSAPTSGSGAAGAALGLSAPAGACFGTPPVFASSSTSGPPPGTAAPAAPAAAAAPSALAGSSSSSRAEPPPSQPPLGRAVAGVPSLAINIFGCSDRLPPSLGSQPQPSAAASPFRFSAAPPAASAAAAPSVGLPPPLGAQPAVAFPSDAASLAPDASASPLSAGPPSTNCTSTIPAPSVLPPGASRLQVATRRAVSDAPPVSCLTSTTPAAPRRGKGSKHASVVPGPFVAALDRMPRLPLTGAKRARAGLADEPLVHSALKAIHAERATTSPSLSR